MRALNKKTTVWSSFFLLVILLSCSVYREPYDSIPASDLTVPSKIAALTLGNYAIIKGGKDELSGWITAWHYLNEYPGDNVALSGTTADNLFFIYNYKAIPNNYRIKTFWQGCYQAIVGCNKVIEIAEEGSPQTNQLIGENYYLRGFLLFQLVNVFGRPYAQGRNNKGIPLKLNADVNNTPLRSSVGEAYDQIVKDLLKAETLMNESKPNIYATKEAAQALLSRVYLYMGDNDNAIEYASRVINSDRFKLLPTEEFKKYFTYSPENNSETIFALKYNATSDYNSGYYTPGSMYATIKGQGWGEMYASRSYLDEIEQYPDDARMAFIDPQFKRDQNQQKIPVIFWVDTTDYRYQTRITYDVVYDDLGKTFFNLDEHNNKKIRIDSNTQNGNLYFTHNGVDIYVKRGFDMIKRNGYPKYFVLKCSLQEGVPQLWSPIVSRLAEMYLNRAEAHAKKGNASEALSDVNIIRLRAGIPPITFVPTGKTILDIVLTERRLELAFEGHRKSDVYRNNLTMDRKYPGMHLSGADPYYEISPTDERIVEFIPESEILIQSNLEQNP